MIPLHTQKSLDSLTWSEIQKLHKSLGLKATAEARTRRDYQRRIVATQPQPAVEPEHITTPLTCAACPLARLIDGNRYCCGLTNKVTRGHWEANSDCYQEIAELETEMTELIATTETPAADIAPSEVQPEEAAIAPTKRAMPFFFNLPLPEYVAFSEKQSAHYYFESHDRAKEYKEQLWLAQRGYEIYGGDEPPTIYFWQFYTYLQLFNPSATYTEVVENVNVLDPTECLEFIISAECPCVIHQAQDGEEFWNYDPFQSEREDIWASAVPEADCFTPVTMRDSIHAIAERLRSSLNAAKNSLNPDPDWTAEIFSQIKEYYKTLPDVPKPSKLYRQLTVEMEVGDYLKTDYAVTHRRTQVVAAKEVLADGRIHFILNCGINPREVFSQEVWLDAPIAHQEIEQFSGLIVHPEESTAATPEATTITADIDNATTDDAPPNRGDNGRGRVASSLPVPTVTITSIPHATKPKADDNFMTAFTKESEGDRKFNDLAYLSQLEMEAQLAIERTVIGSEEEAIALLELAKIEQDIEFYGKPRPYPQPSPVIEQLETQMNELKAEVKQFTLDTSILALADEPEPVEASLDPEGTIYWETPLRGTIVGKKGVKRSFYLRNKDYFGDKNYPTVYDIHIIMSADFTASESKRPNIRHKQIRDAIEAGRAFNSLIFKLSSNFERDTEDYNGIGRLRQECDGRWWAWATTGVTGHSFFSRDIACDYLKDVADRYDQVQKQNK